MHLLLLPGSRYQGAAAAEFALKKGLKTIGMVYEDASYGYGKHQHAATDTCRHIREGAMCVTSQFWRHGLTHSKQSRNEAVFAERE